MQCIAFFVFLLLSGRELTGNPHGPRHCEEKRAEVGHRLGHLHSVYAQKAGQDEYGRDVEQSLPTDGEECGGEGVADVLEQHACGGAQGAEGEHDALPPQGAGTDGNQRGVLAAEQADDLRREDKPQYRQHGEHCGRDAEGVVDRGQRDILRAVRCPHRVGAVLGCVSRLGDAPCDGRTSRACVRCACAAVDGDRGIGRRRNHRERVSLLR